MRRLLMAMGVLLLSAAMVSPLWSAEKKEKKYFIEVNVLYPLDHEIPGKPNNGVMSDYQKGKTMFLYFLEDADVYLLKGQDTVTHVKSYPDGVTILKGIPNGEYMLVAQKKGYQPDKSMTVIDGANAMQMLVLRKEE